MIRPPYAVSFIALILFFCLAGISPPARSAETTWKPITGNSGKEGILYDPGSVTYLSRNLARVWIRTNARDGSPLRIHEEFNCSYKIVRDVRVVTEMPNKPPQTDLVPSDWRGVVKESPLGELFRKICK